MPMRTFLPVFVKDIFHRGPETYGTLLSLMGVGSICGSLIIASRGNIAHKAAPRSCADLPRCGHRRVRAFALLCRFLAHAVAGRRSHDRGLRHHHFARPAHHAQRMRGRVMSVYNFAFRGGMPMGNLSTGWLVPFSLPARLQPTACCWCWWRGTFCWCSGSWQRCKLALCSLLNYHSVTIRFRSGEDASMWTLQPSMPQKVGVIFWGFCAGVCSVLVSIVVGVLGGLLLTLLNHAGWIHLGEYSGWVLLIGARVRLLSWSLCRHRCLGSGSVGLGFAAKVPRQPALMCPGGAKTPTILSRPFTSPCYL